MMMIEDKKQADLTVTDFISTEMKKGSNPESVKRKLIEQGHDDASVEAGYESYLQKKRKKILLLYGIMLVLALLVIVFLRILAQ